MYHDITHILTDLINGTLPLYQVHFVAPAGKHIRTSPCLSVSLETRCEVCFSASGYVPLHSSNSLRISFGKQQLTLQLHRDNALLQQQQVARRGPRTGAFLLQTLNELHMQPTEQDTARLVVLSLLSHCRDLLGSEIHTDSRSRALFEAIRLFIDEHHASALTRDSVAEAFYISPNYLSHLFQKTGNVGFNEYLTQTRLEHARQLLKGYDLKIKDIAARCGFMDSNYFCRLFRKHTERSPSEYRRQYHSQLTAKN
ncbi:AraC family transcriptional regulator [Enterobacter cloacae]|uniref:helix-turn-helix transcriptional regulator n=1 Tax=Enterobacter sichuanensis TaxID=2071710 RepID=UPI0004729A79|nr:helix-turn-helix transcriptional regulator [Enterobacter sichuanensis]MCX4181543.1 helix-turn-helix domain-containing protein [Enterobacter sp. HSTU-ASh6]PAN83725.1 AraC family transcriptional regulator [Enterobacter cloacae]RTN94792.1 AraC family transcriptional regulator [Enterobacter sp. WCHEn090032]MEB5962926.1 helix-turn-helix transcriptional regulator [Enterobacter sichuanensis]PAN97517.1 AraC family transcriptional regulator [Enterobacter cloacae]